MSLASTSLALMLLAAATAYPVTANNTAPDDIPADYLAEYRQSASTCGPLDWALLAGVGKVETDHGRSPLPGVHSGANSASARGPMQFLPTTFAEVRRNHPEVGHNVYNPRHAIHAAAHFLCDSGLAHGNTRRALWAYNHSSAYANDVLNHADCYRNAS